MSIPGQLNPSPRLLLGPGPTDAHPRLFAEAGVAEALARLGEERGTYVNRTIEESLSGLERVIGRAATDEEQRSEKEGRAHRSILLGVTRGAPLASSRRRFAYRSCP